MQKILHNDEQDASYLCKIYNEMVS